MRTILDGMGPICPNMLTLSGPTLGINTYRAAQYINSTQTFLPYCLSNYYAGESIRLLPGFHAARGSFITAQIAECETETPARNGSGIDYSDFSEDTYSKSHIQTNSQSHPSLYPNPTTGNVTIECKGLNYVELFDIQGRKLANYHANEILEIDVSNYNNGIYLVKIYSDNNVAVTKKLVVMR